MLKILSPSLTDEDNSKQIAASNSQGKTQRPNILILYRMSGNTEN
jgi:hypothetical protein